MGPPFCLLCMQMSRTKISHDNMPLMSGIISPPSLCVCVCVLRIVRQLIEHRLMRNIYNNWNN